MMKKIKFLKDCEIEAQGVIVQSFKAGEIVELSMGSARRWLRRNLATEVLGKAKPPKSKAVDRGGKPIVTSNPPAKKRKPPITSASGGDKQAPITSTEKPPE